MSDRSYATPTSFAVLGFFLLCGLCFALGTRGLNEPDEGRYANIANEMLEVEHDVVDPVLSDVHHYDKPPLIYWVTALSVRAFGWSESAVRLPSLAGAVLALIGLGWAAGRLYGADTAWWSLLLCGTMAQFWILARWLTPDMFLTGWTTLAIAAWVESRHRHGDWRWWCLSAAFWTAAWWTKATPALVPLLSLAVALQCERDRTGWKSLRLPLLLPVILILGSPWFILMIQRHHELVSFFFGRELTGRMVGHPDGRHGPIYYYLLISLIAWLPWWPWALAAAIKRIREHATHVWPRFELILIGTSLVVFSLASSKLPTYTLTLAPWAALALARLLQPVVSVHPRWRRAIYATAGIFLALELTAAVAIIPFESSLGRNSSVREVATYLRTHGAKRIYCDRYWPGMEVYFGEDVHYILQKKVTELSEDEAHQQEHFLSATGFKQSRHPNTVSTEWFVHFRKEPSILAQQSDSEVVLGDFELIPLSPSATPDHSMQESSH